MFKSYVKLILGGVAAISILALGACIPQEEYLLVYSNAVNTNDGRSRRFIVHHTLKFIRPEEKTYWNVFIQNTGESVYTIGFWYSPSQSRVYCEWEFYFSEKERRDFVHACSDAMGPGAQDADLWLVPKAMYQSSEWLNVTQRSGGS